LALAVLTLSGTGLLVRSLWNLHRADLGFDPHHVLTASVALPRRDYDDAHAAIFYRRLLDRLAALPGVVSVGAAGWLPVVEAGGLWGVHPEGRAFVPGQMPEAVPQQISAGYLRAMGLSVLAGRDFATDDRLGSEPVVIVSKSLADRFWPNEHAVGKRLKLGNPSAPWLNVVGVVSDIRSRGFGDTPEPTMYFAYDQTSQVAYFQPSALSIVIRTRGEPTTIAPALRAAVRELDRTVPVSSIRTMDAIVGISVADRRFSTALLAGFAALALLLAGVGTYGVISYGVTQRSFEIGVRIALGAGDRSVLALVMSEGLGMSVAGLALGLVASAGLGRGIRSLLVGVSAIDVPTLISAATALLVVAFLACLIPARRATSVSPLTVMRGDG
jgi:predicted permease